VKGTNCTPEQLASAEEFIMARASTVTKRPKQVSMPFDSLVRLVAWYGALRFEAGRDGIGGTLEKPAPMITIRHQ
jgi:hypothetical protein